MTIEKISEEKLRITTESYEEISKESLESRKESLLKDIERTNGLIKDVDVLLANFTQ